MAAKKIALFIDADNISAKFGKQIIETLERRGEIFIRRIYGNWEKTSLHGWNECILNFSLRAVQQPDYVAGKNATDMSLLIDAMDVLYGGKAEVFALVSNDSDFTPLAIRLREGGMKIIGMGNSQATNAFRAACDEFIDLDAPAEVEVLAEPKTKFHVPEKDSSVQINLFAEEKVELKPPAQIKPKAPAPLQTQPVPSAIQSAETIPPAPVAPKPKVIPISDSQLQSERDKKIQQIHDVLHEAAKVHGDAEGFFLLTCAGTEIKNKKLGFGVKDLGFGTLKEFISAFPKLYAIQERGNIVLYRCLTAPSISAGRLQQIHDALRETAKVHGDESGFVHLSYAGETLGKHNLNIKDSGCSSWSKFIAAFPNIYEIKSSGGAFYYRCVGNKQKVSVAKDKLQPIHDILHETAEAYTDLNDAKGFTDLTRAGQEAHKKNLSIKDSGYSSWSQFVSAFPELYAVKKVGSIIYYRCK